MDYRRYENKIVMRLDKGDEVIKSLEKIAREENIGACHFTGIGAIDALKVGYFKEGYTDYSWNFVNEPMEVTSLVGNITRFEDEPMVHAHITCGKKDASMIGGHLGEATCSLTLEIFIDIIDTRLTKTLDPDLGINTIEF